MIQDPAENPGLLKPDRYCKGIRLDDSCFVEEAAEGQSFGPARDADPGWRRFFLGTSGLSSTRPVGTKPRNAAHDETKGFQLMFRREQERRHRHAEAAAAPQARL